VPFGDFIFVKKRNFSFGESSTRGQADIILVCLGMCIRTVIVFFQRSCENYTSTDYCYLLARQTLPFNDTSRSLYTNTYGNGNVIQEIPALLFFLMYRNL